MSRAFAQKFYKSQAWKTTREAYAKQAHWLCEDCLAKGIYRPGEIVHHIVELDPVTIENPEIALSFDNLRLVCRECHANEHRAMYEGRSRRRYTVGDNGEIIAKVDP